MYGETPSGEALSSETGQLRTCRLLVDGADTGERQMAVDEVLLESAAASGRCTLRFYRWSEPTLSLGYFQSHRERETHAPSRQCPLVRRLTGGGAIVHDRELTYSLAMPAAERSDLEWLYGAAHDALLRVLTASGVGANKCGSRCESSQRPESLAQAPSAAQPFLCFQRRSACDVLIGDFKICGSAQRRRRGAVLQHGSLLLAASLAAPELPGIVELAGNELDADRLAADWGRELAAGLHLELAAGELETGEKDAICSLIQQKYSCPAWNQRR